MDITLLDTYFLPLAVGCIIGFVVATIWLAPSRRSHDPTVASNGLDQQLDQLQRQIQCLNENQHRADLDLHSQMARMHQTSIEMNGTLRAVGETMSNSGTRGNWGELHLQRVLEIAGLREHADFQLQSSIRTDDQVLIRPDVVVQLPKQMCVVIDAKVPGTSDDSTNVVQVIRRHILELSRKEYTRSVSGSVQSCIMYLPTEGLLREALQQDPGLVEWAHTRRVIVATPSTLLMMLQSIALVWDEHHADQRAASILSQASKIHERVSVFHRHLAQVGSSLEKAADAYNRSVASFNSRVLPSVRSLQDSAQSELHELSETPIATSDVQRLSS